MTTTEIKNDLNNTANNYMINTHFLNDYNEIHSVNKYLDVKTTVEQQKLRATLDRLNSTLLRMKQEYMLRKYDINSYALKTKIMVTVAVLVCLLLILLIFYSDNQLGKNLLTLILAVVCVTFLGIVYLIVRSNSYRVETNWDAYYWGPVNQKV